ncbi:MAG: Ku protein [Candidatus Zixiibacteriota bacterium]|jgi:DNA end-binding protein Ku
MPEYVWSGTLTFGLVILPVRMSPAEDTGRVAFTMLHDRDDAPLHRKLVCSKDGKIVDTAHQVRGFPVGDDDYVVVTDSELESLSPDRSKSIEIERFVDIGAIEPIYFDRPYYLTPEEGVERPYSLLVNALAETKKAGIARFVLEAREYLVAVFSIEDALVLITLHFDRQRVPSDGIAPKKPQLKRKTVERLARDIKKATRKFDPAQFKDEYEIDLMKIVRAKAKKEGAVRSPAAKGKKVKKQEAVKAVKETLARVREKRNT